MHGATIKIDGEVFTFKGAKKEEISASEVYKQIM
jgi:hypothetical protein